MANRQSSIPLPTATRRNAPPAAGGSALPRPAGSSVAATPSSSRLARYGAPSGTLHTSTSSTASMRQSLTSSGSFGTGSKRPLSSTGFTGEQGSAKRTLASPARPGSRLGASSPDGSSIPPPSSAAYDARTLRDEYERRQLADQLKYEALESQMRELGRQMDESERKHRSLIGQWESERETATAQAQELQEQNARLEKSLRTTRTEHSQMTGFYNDLQASTSQDMQALRSENTALGSKLVSVEAEAGRARQEAELSQNREVAMREERDELEALLEKQEADWRKERENLKWGGEEGEKTKAELSRQLTLVNRLESSNASLKLENSKLMKHSGTVEVLKEEIATLKSRLQGMDPLRKHLAEAEARATSLELDSKEWIRVIAESTSTSSSISKEQGLAASIDEPLPSLPSVPDPLTPMNFPQYLRNLRALASGLRIRCEGLGGQVEAGRQRASEILRDAQAANSDSEAYARLEGQLRTVQERSDRTVTVLKDEVERYKALLRSYELESRSETAGAYDASHAERIAMLEQTNEELNGRVEQLQQELAGAEKTNLSTIVTEESRKLTSQIEELQRALDAARSEHADIVAECARLGAENDSLWERVGRGEFNVANERCIVLKDNPVAKDLAVRTATLDSLRKENSELLKRVEALAAVAGNASGQAGEALVPKQIVDNLKGEIQGLQESIKIKDKAMLRLKQVFSAKANEYREAVRSLFGYKVRFLDNGKVKLTSSFARGSRGTSLVFGSDDGNVGTMKLAGEAADVDSGVANVADLKAYWLSDLRHSVPCFLAALNLELYESTTQAVRAGWNIDEEEDE